MPSKGSVGFIGLGVMGEPMCRNLAEKSDAELIGYDIRPEPFQRLAAFGVMAAGSVADVAAHCDVIFLSLPAAEHVRTVCTGDVGLLTHCGANTTVIEARPLLTGPRINNRCRGPGPEIEEVKP